jgi:hypothetical protein
MLIESILLALIIGLILKGSIKNFKDADLAHIELIFIGFAMETSMVLLIRGGFILNSPLKIIFHLSMYVFLFMFVYINRKHYEILIMGFGFLLNVLAIFTNGGVMPVSRDAMVYAGMGNMADTISSQGLYKLLDRSTILPFLCDVIPRPYPRPFVISAGDIFIAIGVFILVLDLMKCRPIIK